MNVKKLKNKITFIAVKKEVVTPSVLNIYFKVGSRNESAENNGMAHMAEHLFARKLRDRFKNKAFINKLEAFTNKGMTCFNFRLSENEIEDVVKNFKSMLNNLEITQNELQKEKEIVFSEIARDKDAFFYHSDRDFAKKYYRNNSLTLDALGNSKNVEKFTEKDIQMFIKTFYQPSNMVVVLGVSNSYNLNKVKRFLEEINISKEDVYPDFKEKFTGLEKNVFNIFPKDTEQLYISIFKFFPITNYRQIVQWEFFIDLLHNTLHDVLVEKNGYTYDINVSISKYSDFFNLFIDCEVRKEKLLSFYNKLNNILHNLPRELTKERFNELKKEELKHINEEKDSMVDLVDLIGGQAVSYENKDILNFTNIEDIITNFDYKNVEDMTKQLSKLAHFVHLTGQIDKETENKLKQIIEK